MKIGWLEFDVTPELIAVGTTAVVGAGLGIWSWRAGVAWRRSRPQPPITPGARLVVRPGLSPMFEVEEGSDRRQPTLDRDGNLVPAGIERLSRTTLHEDDYVTAIEPATSDGRQGWRVLLRDGTHGFIEIPDSVNQQLFYVE